MEQAIGDQLFAHYARKENGLFSMFTLMYDHIVSYKSSNSNSPDFRRVYSIKQFLYIYSIKQIFVKLILLSFIEKIALAYFALRKYSSTQPLKYHEMAN